MPTNIQTVQALQNLDISNTGVDVAGLVGPVSGTPTATEALIQQNLNGVTPGENVSGMLPYYSSGARALIKIAGRPIAVARRVRWSVTYSASPIHTVDSAHAVDIDVGQSQVQASLERFLDPNSSGETDYLFHTMQSVIHQPLVELQIIDRNGKSLFYAKGMFISMSGGTASNEMSSMSVSFLGIGYKNYVQQSFKPYDGPATSAAGAFMNGLTSLQSSF